MFSARQGAGVCVLMFMLSLLVLHGECLEGSVTSQSESAERSELSDGATGLVVRQPVATVERSYKILIF